MARYKRNQKNLEYSIDDKFTFYGSWEYITSLPAVDEKLYKLALDHLGKGFITARSISKDIRTRNIFQYVKYFTDDFKELSIQFEDYLRNNPWVKDYYNFCLEKAGHVRDPFDNDGHWLPLYTSTNIHSEDILAKIERAKKYLSSGIDFHRFDILCNGNKLLLPVFNELRRPVPFVIGNIVLLRKKCIGARYHDPFYNEPKEIREQDRVGYITAILDDTHPKSYSGKGSRLVNVFWQATGKEQRQSVGSLKLFDQKNNKMVDKIVDE